MQDSLRGALSLSEKGLFVIFWQIVNLYMCIGLQLFRSADLKCQIFSIIIIIIIGGQFSVKRKRRR